MQFTKKLRERIRNGEITTSIRIWQKPQVKAGGFYKLHEGGIVVDSIKEILFEDISETLAKESGFTNLADLMKTAMHGPGRTVYFIRFHYQESGK